MSAFELALLLLLLGLLCPFVVYFSVKLGTYAYLRAKYMFRRDHHSPEDRDEEVEASSGA